MAEEDGKVQEVASRVVESMPAPEREARVRMHRTVGGVLRRRPGARTDGSRRRGEGQRGGRGEGRR